MNLINKDTDKLQGVIELLLQSSSRINESKNKKYWYPLSKATYGVEEIIESLDSLCTFRTTMWEKTLKFERKFTEFQGNYDSVMVNSGSSADLLMCHQLLCQPNPKLEIGDEILIPVVTWPTQIWSAMMAGLKVKLVDVDRETLNIDLNDLKNKISKKTKAIFLVHLMGNPVNMDRILEIVDDNNLILIEDCCEALGAKWGDKNVGTFGTASSFSFFFSHHMTTMEGGLISCSTSEVTDQTKILRGHGWTRNVDTTGYNLSEFDVDSRYAFVNWGFNMRPTEIQASFGLHQLNKLNNFNTTRESLSKIFFEFVDNNSYIYRPKAHFKSKPSWFSLPLVLTEDAPFKRNDFVSFLELNGVETRPIVAGNLARHPVSQYFSEFNEYTFSGADYIHDNGLYLGLSPFSTKKDIEKLINICNLFFKKY
jgi:CDP-4-dehydro-6-deoxyglucose reductase, E1